MLKVSDSIKNAYNQYTTQRKSYIRVGDNSFFVQNLDVLADAYDEGNIIGNAIAKIAKFDIETDNVKGLDEFELFDGIWTGNQYEYVSLGTFKLYDEEGTDDFFSTITAYDKLILFNKPYNPSLTNYPTTIFGLLQNICEQAGVEVENLSIANGNQELLQNLFVEGETLKQILKAILQISGTFGVISQDKLKLTLKNEDSIQLENYQISEPEYKRTTWSINQVVLGMFDVDGEYVQLQDEEDVEINGIHKLVINDNPFVYTQELRQSYISELFEQVKGFGYIAFESKWEGMPFVELGDFLNIGDKESLVLRYNLKSPDGLNSTISAPSLIDSVVEYVNNSDSIENKQKKTEARVDKAEGNIILLTKTTKEIGNNLSENYYSKINVNELIQNAETGVTNTFSEAGGNNVLRNTGLWFESNDTDNPYEFWSGVAKEGRNDNATNYKTILLQNGSFSQEPVVPNGNYSVSFYYKKLIELANASVVINDIEYPLDSLSVKQFYTGEQDSETSEYITQSIQVTNNHIKIEFKCDTNGGVEVYDLMCNKGAVKLAYSQNQNETTTDTVNISKGITITSSVDDVKFKADYDGIRIISPNEDESTKFTDKGTITNELVVRKKAEVTGALHQEVDDQTWINKL